MNEYALTLDLAKAKQRQQQTIFVRQGDRNATTIVATVTDHGVAASTSGLTARFQMRLPDGTHYYRKAASLSGNVATVTLDEAQAASAVGRTDVAYFQLLQGTTVVASTESFTVVVLPDALADATVPESYDSAIQDAIDALDDAVEQLPATVEDVLADHPEWTTTVQDGSITKAKLATDLARDRERLLYRLDNLLTNALPEGETATATDAAKTPMAGLALYGRSTQDGTPTPSAPVAIQSVTPNLAKGYAATATNNGITYVTTEGGATTISGTASSGSAMPLQTAGTFALPAGTYTLVMGGELTASGTGVRAQLVKVVGSSISNVNATPYTTGGGMVYVTFTTTEDMTAFVRISVNSGSVVSGTLQFALYEGGVAYPPVPYGHAGLWVRRTSDASDYTVTPIDLDGHELRSLPDGTRDEVTVDQYGHVTLVQRVGEVELSADWSWGLSGGGGYRVYTNEMKNNQNFAWSDDNRVLNAYSNRFGMKLNGQTYQGQVGISADAASAIQVCPTGQPTSVAEFKTWLQANQTTLLYPLATPVTHDLGTIDPTALVGPDMTAQAVPTAPFALTYERDLNATLARLESAIATLA